MGVQALVNRSLEEEEIREAIEDGDARITDLHVWQIGPSKFAAIISLIAHQPLTRSSYAAEVRINNKLVHATVEAHRCAGDTATFAKAA